MDKNNIRNVIQNNRARTLASSNKNVYPTVPQMANNLGKDIIKTVKSVASGNGLKSDNAQANSRKAICNSCEFFNKAQERCTKCGCYMAVKVYLKASSCPVNKW